MLREPYKQKVYLQRVYKSSKSDIGLFCLLGMTPEFRLTGVSLAQRACVLSGAKRLTGCYCIVARHFNSLYGHMT